ncbi:hypothetical protein [Bacillus horti]|uniref:Transposase-like protein n=1 Tax=Caldalkalibacillus horti TaxID=77523 RepID=A0ABT9VTU6_9BACI|nr:hypothetical protein [Bacillus horti]MDQ0164403.1 transposase-like protein [Bacillus horti]
MSRKSKISGFEKIEAIEKYLHGEDSLNHLAHLLDVSFQTINNGFKLNSSLTMASNLPVFRSRWSSAYI